MNFNNVSGLMSLSLAAVLSVGGTAAAQNSGGQASAIRVSVMAPVKKDVVSTLETPATLLADEEVRLFAKASGYVSDVNVDIGSRVSKGDPLVSISVPEMRDELMQSEAILDAKKARVDARQAKLMQAENRIAQARAELARFTVSRELDAINLERKQKLASAKAVPQQQLDEARSALAVADAQLAIAESKVGGAEADHRAASADLAVARAEVAVAESIVARFRTLMKYSTIEAPFDGIITRRMVDVGAFARSAADGATTALLELHKADRIRVVLEVPEVDAPRVRVGTKVSIRIAALADEPISTTITRIAWALSAETRTMRAEIDIDNADGRLASGMYARVTVELQATAGALVIPSKAVRGDGGRTLVMVVRDGKAEAVDVTIGYDDGIWAEIASGISESDDVITAANGAVQPGMTVTAVRQES